MPREQINYPSVTGLMIYKGNELEYEPGTDVPPGAEVFADPALHVHWAVPEGEFGTHVQISIEVPAGFLKARADGLDENATSTHIITPSLDRREINKLIATLRKARDRAYGRDE